MRLLLLVIGGLRSRERETLIFNLERERWEENCSEMRRMDEGVSFIGIGLGYSLKCPLLLM